MINYENTVCSKVNCNTLHSSLEKRHLILALLTNINFFFKSEHNTFNKQLNTIHYFLQVYTHRTCPLLSGYINIGHTDHESFASISPYVS